MATTNKACTYDPTTLKDVPLGMFHCPECGEMVLAGIPHPDWHKLDEFLEQEEEIWDEPEGEKEKGIRSISEMGPMGGDHNVSTSSTSDSVDE